MDFTRLDPGTITLIVAETVVILGFIVATAVSVFKKYKGKTKLSVEEIVDLSKDLASLAKDTYGYVEDIMSKIPSDFDDERQYRAHLIEVLVDDFDELLLEINPDCINHSVLYGKLSREEKEKIIETIIDKIPSKKDEANKTDNIDEDFEPDTPDPAPTVDMTNYL